MHPPGVLFQPNLCGGDPAALWYSRVWGGGNSGFFISLYIVDTSALLLASDLNVQSLQARYFSLGYL